MASFRPLKDRFFDKVNVTTACWLWTGCLDAGGYGRIRMPRERRTEYAHRVSYQLHVGAIPHGKIICHRCGNPTCVKPDHLYAGTYRQNMIDRVAHGHQSGGARPGEKHHMAKLSDKQVTKIRSMLKTGSTGAYLSRAFGVSQTQISRIKRNESRAD